MTEILMACAVLLQAGLMARQEYQAVLDTLFMEYDSAELLELEWASSDTRKALALMRRYNESHPFDDRVFGRFLMEKLRAAYLDGGVDIQEFGRKGYAVWQLLPETVRQTEPFQILCYADDPLSWQDEPQARALYEKMFRYYDGPAHSTGQRT